MKYKDVTMDSVSYNDLPWKFEAVLRNIAQVIGLGAAIDYINYIGLDEFTTIRILTAYAIKNSKISGLIFMEKQMI